MPRTCLCVLCGLPAAGKSRLAEELQGRARSRGWETLLVTYDELIPARDWSEDEWKQQRKTVLTCLERFLHQTHTQHTHNTHTEHTHTDETHTEHTHTDETHAEHDIWMQTHRQVKHTNTQPLLVLLDDNFYYQSMRYQIYQLARKCMCSSVSDITKLKISGFHMNVFDMCNNVFHMRTDSTGFCQVFVRCPLDVCLQRNRLRSLRVPDEVLLQMSERMEPPNKSRNSWEQQSLTVDSTDSVTHEDVHKLIDLLESALENPLSAFQDDSQQKEANRQICASNILHRADQMCRRLISQAMTSIRGNQASSDVLKVLAKELNELKTHFLQELKKEILRQMSLCPEEPVNTEKLLMAAARAFERDTQHCVQTQIKHRFS